MSRRMPRLAASFQQRIADALELARAGDWAAVSLLDRRLRDEWYTSRVELLYELAYLRMFIEWEQFLEQTFLRYLCGYTSANWIVSPAAGNSFYVTLLAAEKAVLRGR